MGEGEVELLIAPMHHLSSLSFNVSNICILPICNKPVNNGNTDGGVSVHLAQRLRQAGAILGDRSIVYRAALAEGIPNVVRHERRRVPRGQGVYESSLLTSSALADQTMTTRNFQCGYQRKLLLKAMNWGGGLRER